MVEVGNFKFIETKIPDLYIVEPKIFGDTEDTLWKVTTSNTLIKLD